MDQQGRKDGFKDSGKEGSWNVKIVMKEESEKERKKGRLEEGKY